MSDVLRTFLRRLRSPALADLFSLLDLQIPDFDGLGVNKRTTAVAAAIMENTSARAHAEAMAGEIFALCEKGELAEMALRMVCEDRPELLAILETDAGPEERAWQVWRKHPELIDRARNVAMSYHWREGRYHCAFKISDPDCLKDKLEPAVEAIRKIVQEIEGGRRVFPDLFSYREPSIQDDVYDNETDAGLVHHLAVYLEQPASYLMEFARDDSVAEPVIRRSAKELSIVYHERTGRLHVAGAGIGGQTVLADIAEAFCAEAVEGASLSKLDREEYELNWFNRTAHPKLHPPPPFESVTVFELKTRSRFDEMDRATFRAGRSQDVYQRMKHLVVQSGMKNELIRSASLLFTADPAGESQKTRRVRLHITWPSGKSYENATLADQEAIDEWLKGQPFGPMRNKGLI